MTKPSISDLDRCEHGRHATDNCFDCPAPGRLMMGNPHIDDTIGYMVRGEPFTLRDLLEVLDPERAARMKP